MLIEKSNEKADFALNQIVRDLSVKENENFGEEDANNVNVTIRQTTDLNNI